MIQDLGAKRKYSTQYNLVHTSFIVPYGFAACHAAAVVDQRTSDTYDDLVKDEPLLFFFSSEH